jgi:acyl dehydratase
MSSSQLSTEPVGPRGLTFDEVPVGLLSTAGPYQITREEIVEFAQRWDPQDFHLDEQHAAESDFGTLVAPAAMVISVMARLSAEEAPLTATVAGLGLDQVRFVRPVLPDDRLRQTSEVIALRPSRSRSDRGIITARRIIWNGEDQPVLTCVATWMIRR